MQNYNNKKAIRQAHIEGHSAKYLTLLPGNPNLKKAQTCWFTLLLFSWRSPIGNEYA